MALRIGKPTTACRWHNGWVHCATAKKNIHTRKQFFSRTEALAEAIKSTEQIVEELKEVFERLICNIYYIIDELVHQKSTYYNTCEVFFNLYIDFAAKKIKYLFLFKVLYFSNYKFRKLKFLFLLLL